MEKLKKPAKVGAGTFGVGVDESVVIAAAQRQHEYHNNKKRVKCEHDFENKQVMDFAFKNCRACGFQERI